MAAPLVGRDEELTALTRLARGVEQRRGSAAALIRGAPGSGKTRLAHELVEKSPRLAHLFITGYPTERDVPFAAAADLLRGLGEADGAGRVLRELLTAPRHDRSAPIDEVRMFEAAHEALAVIGPLLLVVDDVHWLDPHTAALCHYLYRAAHSTGQPLALVVAGRPSARMVELESSLRRVSPGRVITIDLAGLDLSAARALAREVAPARDDSAVHAAWQRAEGSPFWLQHLLQTDVSTEPREMVNVQLSMTSADGRSLLSLLACAARPVPVDAVPKLIGWNRRRVGRAGDELVAASLVIEQDGTYRLAHDLIREGCVEGLNHDSRRRLHTLLASWLEASSGDDVLRLIEALGHRAAAGSPALDLAVRVATAPNRRLAGRTGLERLTEIAESTPPSDPRWLPLNRAVAQLATELGAHTAALRAWRRLGEIEDDPQRPRAFLAASHSALELRLLDEAVELLERAAAGSQPETAYGVELDAHRAAILQWLEHRGPEAEEVASRAVMMARNLLKRPGMATDGDVRRAYRVALQSACDAALLADDPQTMLSLADELADLSAGSDEESHARALMQGALALRFMGRGEDAVRRLTWAWDEARRRILPKVRLEAGANLAIALGALGRLAEAERVAETSLALSDRLAVFGPAGAFSITLPHVLHLSTADWRAAAEGLALAARNETDPHARLHPHLERAVAMSRLDPDRAADEVHADIELAMACVAMSGCRRCESETLTRGAEALARIGDLEGSGMLLERFHARPQLPANHIMAWRALRADASRAVTAHDPRAAGLLDEVRSGAAAQGLRLEAVWAQIDLARVLADVDRNRSSQLFRNAGAAAEQVGARTEAAVAERGLRALGVRTWRRGPVSAGAQRFHALTEREREIARLASSGASNPDIAAELFLSRKTVERHLSNVMAKLGVRNRAELAALLSSSAPQE